MKAIIKKAGRKIKYALAGAGVMMCVLLLDEAAIVSQAADIKLNSNAKVRSEASTDSTVVTNVSSGATLSSQGEVTGADGYTWYQVSVNGATGYIRSDLADKTSGDMTQAEVERENSYTETSATVSETSVSSGTISVDSANVRKGPSSSDAPVTNVKSGTEVAISGEAIGADGNTWYQISVNGKTGFVRSDLITPAAVEEPEEAEEEAEAEPEEASGEEDFAEVSGTVEISNVISSRILPKDDKLEDMTVDEALLEEWQSGNYYVLYTKDSDGNDDWYLYSLSDNQFEKIKSLHEDEEKEDGGLFAAGGSSKLILLIVGALFIVLILACILLALKLHEYRVYYGDDDDEDDDEDEDEDEDDEDDEEDDDDEDEDDDDERPVRKSRWSPRNFLSRRGEDDDDDDDDDEDDDEEDEEDEEDEDEDEDEDEEYLDDDDFEFEFLNMDGKDKFR